MKKLLYPIAFVLTAFLLAYSCSTEEEDTTPPPSVVKPTTPEPEPEPPAPTQYTLTVTAGEGGSVSTEGGTYDEGTEISVTATPDEGYEFVGWFNESGGLVSEEITFSINIGTDFQLTSSFNQITQAPSGLFTEKILNIDNVVVSQPSELLFGNDTEYQETDYYYIIKKGWIGFKSDEQHDSYYYGTNLRSAGFFYVNLEFINKLDLNGDSLEDMIFGFSYGPHTAPSNQTGNPLFAFINLGDGTFEFTQEYFSQDFERRPMSMYRSAVADLNNDGIEDFILGMRGEPVISQIDGGTDSTSATPILALSNGNGYNDNSENLVGIYQGTVTQEDDKNNDGIADFLTDRAIALGDFDNDGDVDFFMESRILLNDGNGNFSRSSIQLDDSFIPIKLDPPYANTYEAHSNDFNNDGYDDIIIAPDSGYIVRNGGSGWVAMSNGTANFSEWEKVQLPNPRYLNNSKLNDFESTDFDNDGFIDIIVATTRDEPYYRGSGIQLLKNNSGNGFLDVTNSKVDDQSEFDQWQGEGDLILDDFNGDNVLDIIHLTSHVTDGPPNIHRGTNIYINNNGYFEIYDVENKIPHVYKYQFEGYENDLNNPIVRENDIAKLGRAYPVNKNNDGKMDFISWEQEVGNDENPRPQHKVFYTIMSK